MTHPLDPSADWAARAERDSDIGGHALQSNLQMAKEAMNAFGGDKLAANLGALGDHPLVIKALASVAKEARAAGVVTTRFESFESRAERFYDSAITPVEPGETTTETAEVMRPATGETFAERFYRNAQKPTAGRG